MNDEVQSQKKQIFYNKKTKVVVIYDIVDEHNYKLVITPYYSDDSKELMTKFKLYKKTNYISYKEVTSQSTYDAHIIKSLFGYSAFPIFDITLIPLAFIDEPRIIDKICDDYNKYLRSYYINGIIGKDNIKKIENKKLNNKQKLIDGLNNNLNQATSNKISNQIAIQNMFTLVNKATKLNKNKPVLKCDFGYNALSNLKKASKKANINLIGDSNYQRARDNMYQTVGLNALKLQLSDFLLNTFIAIDDKNREIKPITLKNVKELTKYIINDINLESKEVIIANVASYLAKHSKYIK